MPEVDLFREPLPRIGVTVAQEHHPGRHLADKIQHFLAVGVGGEIEFLDFTEAGDLCRRMGLSTWKVSPGLDGAQPAAGGVGIGVTDEKIAWRLSPTMRVARSWAAVFSLIMPAVSTNRRPLPSFMVCAWFFSSTCNCRASLSLRLLC